MANTEEVGAFDAGDPRQVKRSKSKDKLAREEQIEALRKLLQHYDGRLTLWYILEQCGIHHSNPGGDSFETGRHEGKRDIGNWLLVEIFTAEKKAYTMMRNEADERAEKQRK